MCLAYLSTKTQSFLGLAHWCGMIYWWNNYSTPHQHERNFVQRHTPDKTLAINRVINFAMCWFCTLTDFVWWCKVLWGAIIAILWGWDSEHQCVPIYLPLQVNADDCMWHLSHNKALASAKKGKRKSHLPICVGCTSVFWAFSYMQYLTFFRTSIWQLVCLLHSKPYYGINS